MNTDEVVRFSDTLTIRCEFEMLKHVRMAARRRGQKPSEYHRQAIRDALRADGFDLAPIPASDTGDAVRASNGEVAA